MKEIYEAPEMELVSFEAEDVIATSNPVTRFVPTLPEDDFTDTL